MAAQLIPIPFLLVTVVLLVRAESEGKQKQMASDLMLATNRFRHPFKAHRLSLFLYYGGQLLIALSPSYFS